MPDADTKRDVYDDAFILFARRSCRFMPDAQRYATFDADVYDAAMLMMIFDATVAISAMMPLDISMPDGAIRCLLMNAI